MADIDLQPTAEMAANAKRGLALRDEHGRGGTEIGVARARDISNRKVKELERKEENARSAVGRAIAERLGITDRNEKAAMAKVEGIKIRPGKHEDQRVFTATVDGKQVSGVVNRGWSRLGGWGYEAQIDGVAKSAGAQMSTSMRGAIERAAERVIASRPDAVGRAIAQRLGIFSRSED